MRPLPTKDHFSLIRSDFRYTEIVKNNKIDTLKRSHPSYKASCSLQNLRRGGLVRVDY